MRYTTQLRRSVGRGLLHARAWGQAGTVPLSTAVGLQRMLREQDVLPPAPGRTVSLGRDLWDPELASLLSDEELGTWALDADVMASIASMIETRQVRHVLEFGSGVSTLVWSVLLRRLWGPDETRVFAIEQQGDHVIRTRELLRGAGSESLARVHHVPLGPVASGGAKGSCYQLDRSTWERLLGPVRPGLLIVDGPSGEPGVRRLTLPLAHPWLMPGAVIVLDDALRTAELSIARAWQQEGLLDVHGVSLAGKGALVGTRAEPTQDTGR